KRGFSPALQIFLLPCALGCLFPDPNDMLTLLRTLSLGYFSQHRARSVLVVLSIALGVATLVATQALNRSLKVGVENGVNPLASLADLVIDNGQVGVPAALAEELRHAAVPGVQSVT